MRTEITRARVVGCLSITYNTYRDVWQILDAAFPGQEVEEFRTKAEASAFLYGFLYACGVTPYDRGLT